MKGLKKILFFIAMLTATFLLLRVLNFIPLSLEKESIREYKTIEDARLDLRIDRIILPSYFPQHLAWPPAEIFARKKPYEMVLMHFRDRNTGKLVLAIQQADPREPAPVDARISLEKVIRTETIDLKDRPAAIVQGVCDGESCNVIRWMEAGYSITVIEKGPLEELLRIAESMLTRPIAK
jgi:hypothetical protein